MVCVRIWLQALLVGNHMKTIKFEYLHTLDNVTYFMLEI